MSNRASSFPADTHGQRWYRERWPWALMAGPLAVVIASLASAWIAVQSDDGVVAEDYYKQGLLINRKLAHKPPAERIPGANITVGVDKSIHVHLYDAGRAPSRLQLALALPSEHRHDHRVSLTPSASGDWVGTMPELAPGRWIVTLASDTWQLPITIVVGPFREIMLGAVGHS
jgi:uncharacterized protein